MLTKRIIPCLDVKDNRVVKDFLGGSEHSPARIRIREACDTGASIVAVACPNCLTMLEDAVKAEDLEETLKIRNISEIVGEVCMVRGTE